MRLYKKINDFTEIYFYSDAFLFPCEIVVKANGEGVEYYKRSYPGAPYSLFYRCRSKRDFVEELFKIDFSRRGGKRAISGLFTADKKWRISIRFPRGKALEYCGKNYPPDFAALSELFKTSLAV